MASNIRVVLEVDNKKYIADVKAADQATQAFAKNTDKNLSSLGQTFSKAGSGIEGLGKKLTGLRSVLVGLAFGAVGNSALQLADSLQDLSNSSGIAVGTLLELKKALVVSGGEGEALPQAINTLLRSIDEAADGSVKAQNAFSKLGISLTDLATLSEKDLMVKTLEGIAKLPTATERATAMMDKFGKSFKTVDPQELLDKFRATAGEGDKYAASIKRAAELNDKLATAQGNLKLAFIEAFAGPIQKIADFSDLITGSTSKMETLVTAIKAVGIALATAFAVSGALGLVTIIGQIGRAITVVLGLSTGMAGIFAASGSLMVGLRGVAVLIAAIGTSVFAASQLFDDFGSIGENAAARITEAMGRLAASILNLPTDAIAGLIGLMGVKIDNPFGLGDGFNKIVDQAERARKDAEYIKKIGSGRGTAGGPTAEELIAAGRATNPADKPSPIREIDTTATQNAIANIKEITAEYRKQQAAIQSKIAFEAEFIGKSENEKQLAEAQRKLAEDYLNLQDQLIKKRESLTKEEREQGVLGKVINDQIKEAAQGFTSQFEALTKVVQAEQMARKLEEDRVYFLDLQTKSLNSILDVEMAIANFTRSEDDRKIAAIQRQIKLEEDAAVKREQTRAGATPIGAEKEAEIRDRVRKSMEGQLDAQLRLNVATKENDARLFVLDLQNSAISTTISLQAELAKLTMTADQQRIQDLKTQNDLLVAQEVAKRNALLKPGESISASEIATITAQVTAANQGLIDSTQALINKSREFSTGWQQAFVKYKDDASNSALQSKTYFDTFTRGVEDAFVKFVQTGKLSFKDLANTMIAEFARIQAKQMVSGLFGGMSGGGGGGGFFGNILGSIGSIFGFANGGNPAIGKPMIVGERGPELMIPRNASTIVPNNQLGGGTNQTVVTYNIQAVDASSFQQLLARDPQFLHAVAEKGRRSLPQGVMR